MPSLKRLCLPCNFRGPRMGRWISGRWICVRGAPDFCPKIAPKLFKNEGFEASGLKIGAPQNRGFNDHGSNAPFSAL